MECGVCKAVGSLSLGSNRTGTGISQGCCATGLSRL